MSWTPTVQQQEHFQQLYEFILDGNRYLNLTRITDPQEFWEKHLWDSLRGIAFLLNAVSQTRGQGDEEEGDREDKEDEEGSFPSGSDSSKPVALNLETTAVQPLLPTPDFPTFIDIGTGAGFPGIPVAMTVPNSTVTLVDSTRKKIAFLDKVRDALHLKNIKTVTARAEDIGWQREHRKMYDVALIRAVGTASVCAEYTLPLLKQGGLAVIYRGTWTEEETKSLENAVKQLGGTIETIEEFTTPLTHSIRHCLYLRKVAATPNQFPRAVGVPTQKPL
ncbi:16S rRNA (guanine(527)-N(7))-methyltransferase RsmG [Scytonema sp. NUACC21]